MNKSYDNFIKIATEKEIKNSADFSLIKRQICKELKISLPANADLRECYEKMVNKKEIKRNPDLEKALFSKKNRTQSGVAVVAVLTKPYPCPGKCIYCPSEKEMPKSYLSNEPAVMRAIMANFNPYLQVQRRIRALELNGHKTDKIELIVMGGTFSYFPKPYQIKFITQCFKACNEYEIEKSKATDKQAKSKIKRNSIEKLIHEQKKNEKAKHRIIGLTLETRPDYIDHKELVNFRSLGCTRVELGIQSIFDEVLKKNKRGHFVQKTIEATRLLKDFGFKINYHIMPGLLGSDLKKDYQMFQELFSNQEFQPDMLKIYPTVVIRQSELYNLWKNKKYIPLSEKYFEKFILKVKNEIIPPYVRISRLVRDVPENRIIAGPKISNLRQIIAEKSNCSCIRCREVRSNYTQEEKIILNRIDYASSDGHEIFLEYVSPDKKKLFALLRLRIPSFYFSKEKDKTAGEIFKKFPILKNSAIIREVHTYGKMTEIDQKDKDSPQHIGLGKKLIQEAEKITKREFGLKKIAVISGIGARGYYRKLNYKLKDEYMTKKI